MMMMMHDDYGSMVYENLFYDFFFSVCVVSARGAVRSCHHGGGGFRFSLGGGSF